MITISPELYERVCAFVRLMADSCRRCLRPKSQCDNCDLAPCRFLESALAELRRPIESRRQRINQSSFSERCAYYLAILKQSGRYMSSREIDPKNAICGRGLKYWTLRKMVKLGILKTFCDGGRILFAPTNKETK